ncbi:MULTISPECIES: maleylpyruvate isomerase N-terminal domain-containing protein [unclassified Luteococcus]|uniref:maleylpyruvate isomerase N-terminal domain-containing protein n=1 Tax=unclassified Luteococcus TaxID=2639923 RepID=UPI00313E5F83
MSENRKAVAEHHAAVAKNFARLTEHVSDWSAPTPVDGWRAVDVVRHLIEWSRGLFGSAEGVTFGQIDAIAPDPANAWRHHCEQLQTLLDNPKAEQIELRDKHFGRQPLVDAIENYYVPDIFMHSWDLAVATGQNSGLDSAECARMLRGMKQQEKMLRESGEFGQQQPVADDASSEQKLIAFIGRDPYWVPPTE